MPLYFLHKKVQKSIDLLCGFVIQSELKKIKEDCRTKKTQ